MEGTPRDPPLTAGRLAGRLAHGRGAPPRPQNWAGERGVLYWMNRLATGGLVVMVIAWIFIRFIGPGLGLYTVVDPFADMPPPPMR